MKKSLTILCILALCLAAFGCTRLEGGEPEAEIISNGGLAIQQGDWIYFINGAMPETADKATADSPVARIYRMRTDGTQKQAVSSGKAYNMYLYRDVLYFTSPGVTELYLCSVNINGTGEKRLFTFDDADMTDFGPEGVAVCHDGVLHYFDYATAADTTVETGNAAGVMVSNRYVYYYVVGEASTKRVPIGGGTAETISTHSGPFLYADDTDVYIAEATKPYHINANTRETAQISDTSYSNLLVNTDTRIILCMESTEDVSGLYTLPLDNVAGQAIGEGEGMNKARKKVHPRNASAYTTTADFIFFVEADTGTVYRMSYQGTEKTVLGSVPNVYHADAMDVTGEYLYLFDSAEYGKAYRVPVDGSEALTVLVQ